MTELISSASASLVSLESRLVGLAMATAALVVVAVCVLVVAHVIARKIRRSRALQTARLEYERARVLRDAIAVKRGLDAEAMRVRQAMTEAARRAQ